MNVAGGVFERAEDQDLPSFQVPARSSLSWASLPSFCRQLLGAVVEALAGASRPLPRHVELSQIVFVQIDLRQALDVCLGLCHGVQFIGQAARCQVVLLVSGQEPDDLLEVPGRDDFPIEQVVEVGLLKRQGPSQAQAEGLDTGFQSLEKSGLEDADEGDLAPFFPLVILLVLDRLFLSVRFHLVRGKCQTLDGWHDFVVEPAVGRAKAV